MLRIILRLISFVAVVLFITATIIKFVQKTSYREAVGIMEEMCKEMKKNCCCQKAEESAPEA